MPASPTRFPHAFLSGFMAAALTLGLPGLAQAAPKSARVCAARAVLVESPGGATIGIVHHGDRLLVLNGSAHAQWWRVATNFGTRGWLRHRYLCGEDK